MHSHPDLADPRISAFAWPPDPVIQLLPARVQLHPAGYPWYHSSLSPVAWPDLENLRASHWPSPLRLQPFELLPASPGRLDPASLPPQQVAPWPSHPLRRLRPPFWQLLPEPSWLDPIPCLHRLWLHSPFPLPLEHPPWPILWLPWQSAWPNPQAIRPWPAVPGPLPLVPHYRLVLWRPQRPAFPPVYLPPLRLQQLFSLPRQVFEPPLQVAWQLRQVFAPDSFGPQQLRKPSWQPHSMLFPLPPMYCPYRLSHHSISPQSQEFPSQPTL